MTEELSAVNPHATFCGNRRRVTASDDPVGAGQPVFLPRPFTMSASYVLSISISGHSTAKYSLRQGATEI